MLKEAIIFVAGAAVGGVAAALYFKKKYAKKADDEIRSVVEAYEEAMTVNQSKHVEEKNEEPPQTNDIPKEDPMKDYTTKITNYPDKTQPYAITMEEYERNDRGYFQEMLFYYADDVVANVNDEKIDVDATIGREALRILDEEFGDKIYIRNEELGTEWEVNNDPRTYKEITESWAETSDGEDD